MTPLFPGQIINGILHLTEKQKFTDYLKTLEGKEVECVVGKRKNLRTQQQMRYYWGVVVKIIADDSGDDADSIHEFLKDKFAPKKIITVKGEARRVSGCTHDLFTDNFFSDYVDRIRVWYAQDGGYIPDPSEIEVQP